MRSIRQQLTNQNFYAGDAPTENAMKRVTDQPRFTCLADDVLAEERKGCVIAEYGSACRYAVQQVWAFGLPIRDYQTSRLELRRKGTHRDGDEVASPRNQLGRGSGTDREVQVSTLGWENVLSVQRVVKAVISVHYYMHKL